MLTDQQIEKRNVSFIFFFSWLIEIKSFKERNSLVMTPLSSYQQLALAASQVTLGLT